LERAARHNYLQDSKQAVAEEKEDVGEDVGIAQAMREVLG
jgi:hypothetical protein